MRCGEWMQVISCSKYAPHRKAMSLQVRGYSNAVYLSLIRLSPPRKHTENVGLVGGEGIGDAEGGEGGVVGVCHVDFEGAAGGGFPEFGHVEGGVVAAAEVG